MGALASWVPALGAGNPMSPLLYPQVFRMAGLPTSYPTCVCVWGALGCNTSVSIPFSHFLSLSLMCLGWPTDLLAPPKEMLLKLPCQGLPLQCFRAEMEGMHFGNPASSPQRPRECPCFSLMVQGLGGFPQGFTCPCQWSTSFFLQPPTMLCVSVCLCVCVHTCTHMHVCMGMPMCMNSGASFQCVTCISHFCMIYSSAYSMSHTHTSCSRHIR